MLHRWTDKHDGDVTKAAWDTFMNIGYGTTARSPLEAVPLCMFRKDIDTYLMNRDRLLPAAIDAVQAMSDGYSASRRPGLSMPGRETWRDMQDWLGKAHAKGHLTPHDVTTGTQIAMIVTGGDIDAGTELCENDLCALEREAFVSLCKTAETRARLGHLLQTGSPLRKLVILE